MRLPVRAAIVEARSIAETVREAREPSDAGRVVVTGMLAEQLVRELAAGADSGAVVPGDPARLDGAAVVVHVMAGEPSAADEDLVRRSDASGVPVVLVQLWPQAEWTRPFVLTPFVVECRAGEGFPVAEISGRIVEAVERPLGLARRVPVLRETVGSAAIRATAFRAGLIGALGRGSRGSRPVLTLEQVRMLGELQALRVGAPTGAPALVAPAAAAVTTGFLLREAARRAARALPAPLVNAVVAAAGTWALGAGFRRFAGRLP